MILFDKKPLETYLKCSCNMIYADYQSTNLALKNIEEYMQQNVYQFYCNIRA